MRHLPCGGGRRRIRGGADERREAADPGWRGARRGGDGADRRREDRRGGADRRREEGCGRTA